MFRTKTGGGAGNRTPVRQGPAAGFSVRSLRFSVGSGLPETGYPYPSSLRLDLTRENEARGAVTICDVHIGILATETPRNGSLLKRPVRSYRWQLLFAPCFSSFGNSARCPEPSILPSRPVAPIFICQKSFCLFSFIALSMSLFASRSAMVSRLS